MGPGPAAESALPAWAAAAVVLAGLSGCPSTVPPYAGAPPRGVQTSGLPAASLRADAAPDVPPFEVPCHGIGGMGPAIRYLAPSEDDLPAGGGAALTSAVFLACSMRLDLGAWGLVSADRDDSAGMAECSLGFGPYLLVAGVGGALPLWSRGEIEFEPTCLGYAEVWLPSRVFVSIRHTWYSADALLGGRTVDLDGWSVNVAFMF